MLAELTSLWTVEQTSLTIVIAACCLLLAVARPKTTTTKQKSQSKRSEENINFRSHVGAIALALVLIAVAGFLLERRNNPLGVRTDSWSDANVLISGQNYARAGLFSRGGAAQHQLITDQNPPDPFFLYNRYPVGSNLINGLWQSAGVKSLAVYRLLPAACSLLSVLLWFGVYKQIAGRTVAVVAAVTMALSHGFLAYADNLHFHAYAMLTSVAAMCCYLRAMHPDERQRLCWFWLTGLCMFATALLTWEYHLWMVLFIAIYALLFKCPVRRPYLALLGLPLLIALALQAAQQRLAFADVPAEADKVDIQASGLLESVYERTLGFSKAVDTPRGLTLAGYPRFLLSRYYKFYGLPALAALAMLLMLLMRDRRRPWKVRDWPDETKLAVVLVCAGLGWWLIMLQHTAVHPHTMRHGLAGYALLMALVWVRCGKTIRSATFHLPARVAAAVLLIVLCYPQLEGLICNLRLHYQDQYQDDRQRARAGFAEARRMSPLETIVPPGAVILTNHNRLPLMRYWSQRPVYSGLPNKFSPDDPENGRMIIELRFNHLRELYHDQLPPLYFVYRVRAPSAEAAFRRDGFLRFFLLGSATGDEPAWRKAAPILANAWQTGHSEQSFCPIVARIGNLLVFKLDPLVPALRRGWGSRGFPTRRQFGRPR